MGRAPPGRAHWLRRRAADRAILQRERHSVAKRLTIGGLQCINPDETAPVIACSTPFALAVAGWGVFTLQDSVLTALRGVFWVPVENALFGMIKIALLVALAGALPSLGIFISWNLAVIAALIPEGQTHLRVDEVELVPGPGR